ncbi:MAG: helix-turn-helix transcriptional regulator [Hydrogenoanaerobacterium sp.]
MQKLNEMPQLVCEAEVLIRKKYAYIAGIDELAQTLAVSKPHLIREFSLYMGIPPGKYLCETRLKNAKLLLRTGEYNLEAIADMVGFAGANYFCKVFKKATGQTPRQYAKIAGSSVEAAELEQVYYL